MAHVRKQIRAFIKAALIAADTGAGSNVFTGNVYPHDTLPAITIFTKTEESETKNWATLRRFVNVVIEATDEAGSGEVIDDLLDDLAEEIETVMLVDKTFGGLAKTAVLIATDDELTGSVEKPKGTIILTYKCEYRTAF